MLKLKKKSTCGWIIWYLVKMKHVIRENEKKNMKSNNVFGGKKGCNKHY